MIVGKWLIVAEASEMAKVDRMASFVEFPGRQSSGGTSLGYSKRTPVCATPRLDPKVDQGVLNRFCDLNRLGARHCHRRGSESVDKLAVPVGPGLASLLSVVIARKTPCGHFPVCFDFLDEARNRIDQQSHLGVLGFVLRLTTRDQYRKREIKPVWEEQG